MADALPSIAKTAERLMLRIEEAVAHFPRKHRYARGADLRRQAGELMSGTHRAWREPARQLEHIEQLSRSMDEFKLSLRIAKRLDAFRSFGEFEAIARDAFDLGRQCGGWLKSLRQKGQNGSASPRGQRTRILSSRVASHSEAHP